MRYRCQLCNHCLTLAGWQADLAVQVTVSICLGLYQYLFPPQEKRVSLWQFKDDVPFPDCKDAKAKDQAIAYEIIFVMFPATKVDLLNHSRHIRTFHFHASKFPNERNNSCDLFNMDTDLVTNPVSANDKPCDFVAS